MSAADRTGSVAPANAGGLEMTTRRTITATAEHGHGMTLDELAGFLRQAMAAGLAPDTPVRVRSNRKGAVTSVSVEGTARA
jgi:hypothetical protein